MTDWNGIITPAELANMNITASQPIPVAPPTVFSVHADDGSLMVAMHHDGHLEYGAAYEPDEAARRFWDGIEQWSRTLQYGAPLNASIDAQLAAGEKAQKQVKRLDQMATTWKERLPETINRDTAVEAIHQVTRPDGESGPGDPRQPAYDAVFAYIRQQPRDFLPTTVVGRNAMIWRAVHAALDAADVPGAAEQEG